jgi:hypothetical protein
MVAARNLSHEFTAAIEGRDDFAPQRSGLATSVAISAFVK